MLFYSLSLEYICPSLVILNGDALSMLSSFQTLRSPFVYIKPAVCGFYYRSDEREDDLEEPDCVQINFLCILE